MKKTTKNLGEFKLVDNDILLDIITHNGAKMFHAVLPTMYASNTTNHILHTNIISFYIEILSATEVGVIKTGIVPRFTSFDERLGDCIQQVSDVLDLGIKIIEEDKNTYTTKDMGIC